MRIMDRKLRLIWLGVLIMITSYGFYVWHDVNIKLEDCKDYYESKHMYGFTDCGQAHVGDMSFPLFIIIMSLMFGWLPFGISSCKKKESQTKQDVRIK